MRRSPARVITLVLVALLLLPSILAAQECGSVGSYTAAVWQKYIEEAREAGCLSPVKGPRKYVACAIRAHANQLHIFDRMVGWWNTVARGQWATIGPRRVMEDWQTGTLRGTSGRLWMGTAPVNTGVATIEVEKLDGVVPTEIVVCATRDDGELRRLASFDFAGGSANIGRTFTVRLEDLEADLLTVRVDGKGLNPLARFNYRIRLTLEPHRWNLGPVPGFADLHLHQAAELGFGGNQIWGDHFGPAAEALRGDGIAESIERAVVEGPVAWRPGLHSLPGFMIGEGQSRHGAGHPDYERWPHFNDVTHQQVHEDWLKDAHAGGLNLIVVSAVNFEGFCYILKAMYPKPNDNLICRDMDSIQRQLEAFVRMDEERDWYEIAMDPWHARKIIHDGKLAVVLSLEASHLLPPDEGFFILQLDRLWGMGLRSLQLAHETDTQFAGAAPHRDIFEFFQALKWHYPITNPQAGYGFVYDDEGKNAMGLTQSGRTLVEGMIKRRMLIDIAHLSEQAVRDVYQFSANAHAYYPLYNSHTRFEAVLTEDDRRIQQEFLTTDEQIRYIRRTGGMVGLRTGQNAILSVRDTLPGDTIRGVLNDCPGSSKSFAQLVHYGKRAGIQMALGTDLNGFINQLGPRFGDEACPAAEGPQVYRPPDTTLGQCGLAPGEHPAAPTGSGIGRRKNFAYEGLRHVGYTPDLLADLDSLATPGIDVLKHSAEAFLRMWERAWDPDRTLVPDDVDLNANVAADVPDSPLCPPDDDEEEDGVITLTADRTTGGGNEGGRTGDGGNPGGGNQAGGNPDDGAGGRAAAGAAGDTPGGGPGMGAPGNSGLVGGAWGDVHMRTFDGSRYDFQAVGEFVAARSAVDDLEVQLRMQPWQGSDRVSVTTAVAARISGTRVTVTVGAPTVARVDGVPVAAGEATTRDLPGGGRISAAGTRWELTWPDGSTLAVRSYGHHLSAHLAPAGSRRGSLSGLYGDMDGDRSNDFVTASGARLERPIGAERLYGEWGSSWRIDAGASLFDYEPGENTATFTDLGFPRATATVATLSAEARERAERICRDAGVTRPEILDACIVDVGHAGDDEFASAALSAQVTEETTTTFEPVPVPAAPEPVVSGLCRPGPETGSTAAFRADVARSGTSSAALRDFRAEPVWAARGFRGGHDPLVVGNRVIAARLQGLSALDAATGEVVWEAAGTSRIAGQGLLASGGAVFAAWTSDVAAYDLESGAECWRLPIGPATSAGFADGRVFVSVDEGATGYVAAIEAASGLMLWRHDAINPAPANWPSPSTPSLGGGAVFVADGNDVLALDQESGEPLWRTTTGGGVRQGLAYADGVVYVPDTRTGVNALDAATGNLLWTWTEAGGGTLHGWLALSSEFVYVVDGQHLHAIRRESGTKAWSVAGARAGMFHSPSLAGDLLYTVTQGGELVVLDARRGTELHRIRVGTAGLNGAGSASPGDLLYLMLPGGNLRALR